MEPSLVTTKLNIPPPRPHFLSRPRLAERLDEGLHYNLVLVSAPAGFGKTSLLSEWSRRNRLSNRTCWVSLDEGDGDPTLFWDYIIASVKRIQPDFGKNTLDLLHSGQPPGWESIITVLVNELAAIAGEFIIILDDYHMITSQEIYDGVRFLIDHLPPQLHIIIIARSDPSLPLAHYRGKGTMLEIGADELRFTTDEAEAFFRQTGIPDIDADDIFTLNMRTEGWVVGLRMVALALLYQRDAHGFITGFSGNQRYIMDYLLEEVLDKQTPEIQEFLLKTSILERLNGPLCDTVTGRQNSSDVLLELEKNHLFLVPLDDLREWFRYEHLFRDLLRHRLTIRYQEGTIVELHSRACRWCKACHYIAEAVNYSVAAQEWDQTIQLVIEYDKARPGENGTLYNWLKQVPENRLRTNIPLYLKYVSCLAVAQPDDAGDALKYLENTAADNPVVLYGISTLRLWIAFSKGEYDAAIELGKEALTQFPQDADIPRADTAATLGTICITRCKYTEAERPLQIAFECYQRNGAVYESIRPLTYLGLIALARNEVHQSHDLFRRAIEIDEQSPLIQDSLLFDSLPYYDWNELESAIATIQRVIGLNPRSGDRTVLERAYLYLFQCQWARDEKAALDALREADRLLDGISHFPELHALNATFHVKLALSRGDTASASAWVEKMPVQEFLPPDTPPEVIYFLISSKHEFPAAHKWRADYERMMNDGLTTHRMFFRVSQALDARTPAEGLPFLAEALALGRPENRIRTFANHEKRIVPLLRLAVARDIEAEFAGKILNVIDTDQRHRAASISGKFSQSDELLSEREAEVLKLLAEGLSNQQIAEKLVIGVSTTKTHVHNILGKLEAGNRTQALARARKLKLV